MQHDRAPISVVIPTYNHGQYVLAAIWSVRRQTIRPLEIIVVNDGSRDDTEEGLAELAQSGEIRYLRQANDGQAAARNAGAALARGRYRHFSMMTTCRHPTRCAGASRPSKPTRPLQECSEIMSNSWMVQPYPRTR